MKLGFREDKRAVSALVGAILLLAILIIALSSYQAFIVPNQNAETEFDHNQQVEDEMVELRNALYDARLGDRERAASVKLGTRYQSRTIAVNPPPATGTLQSDEKADMIVDHDDGDFNVTNNQFIEYRPSYSQYRDAGTIRYENTLVAHEFDQNVILSTQRLVDGNNNRITLLPSAPEINENGVDRVTYEPTPSQRARQNVNNPSITIPTELEADDWRDLLRNELDDSEDFDEEEDIRVEDGNLTVDFAGSWSIVYPAEDGPEGDDEDEEGDAETEINPTDDIILTGASRDGNDVTATFSNEAGEPISAEKARVSFLITPGSTSPTSVTIAGTSADVAGSFVDIDVVFEPGETEILYEFGNQGGGLSQNYLFGTTIEFENNRRATYFVSGEF